MKQATFLILTPQVMRAHLAAKPATISTYIEINDE